MTDAIIDTNAVSKPQQNSDKKLRIAIVDDFTTKSVFIDWDETPDISHGRAVKRFIEEGLPQAQIDTFDTKSDSSSEVNKQLDAVLKDIENGKKYDALNLSMGTVSSFADLSEIMGVQITPDNVAQKKDSIREWMARQKGLKSQETIQKLDEISSKGVSVYVAAGNHGKKIFSLYSLSKDVKTVGSLDGNGCKDSSCANNSLINSWGLGIFNINKTQNKKGQAGFDFTGDGSIDVYENETSSPTKIPTQTIEGTSIAAPLVLVKDFKKLTK